VPFTHKLPSCDLALLLAKNITVITLIIFLSSCDGFSELVSPAVVVVVVIGLLALLVHGLVAFNRFAFRDKLRPRSESGDIALEVELLLRQ
jgi:hypothetical protein